MDVSRTFSYSSRRSEEAFNTGRTLDVPVGRNRAGLGIRKRYILLLGLLILVVIAVKIVSLSTSVNIIPLSTNRNVKLSAQQEADYKQAASKYLASSILNRNKLTVDTEGLSRDLLSSYPEISSVNATVPFLSDTLNVYIGPAQPAIILNESDGVFAVDDNGRVMFKIVPSQVNSMGDVPSVTDQSGLNVHVNKLVLPSEAVSFIQQVVGQLKAKGMPISSMTLPSGTGELDVRVVGESYYIKFNLENNDPRQQAGTYLATIAQLKSEHVTPSQYVDVRVDGRAYYK